MKTAFYLFMLFLFGFQCAFAQRTLLREKEFNKAITRQTSFSPDHDKNQRITESTAIPKKVSETVTNPTLLKHFINDNLGSQTLYADRIASNSCVDTSFTRLFSTYASRLFIQEVNVVRDGGVLISITMYDTTLPQPSRHVYGLLLKVDSNCNYIWMRQFDKGIAGSSSVTISIRKVFELANNDLICTGSIDTTSGGSRQYCNIYRLTGNGSIIWSKTIKTTLPYSSPDFTSISIKGLAEGINGEIILCGTTFLGGSPGYETIIRMDGMGNIIWDANYGNYGSGLVGAEGVSVYIENGTILVAGITHGDVISLTRPAINFIKLDYNTGSLISKRFFRVSYPNANETYLKSFAQFHNKCIRLSNGGYIFYGQLISDMLHAPIPITQHFGVVEFNSNMDLTGSYTIGSEIGTDFFGNLLEFDSTGKGLVATRKFANGQLPTRMYLGAFQNHQFQNQRIIGYPSAQPNAGNGFHFLRDNGYLYIQSRSQNNNTESYIEIKKMHNSDTSSFCMGIDSMFFRFSPLSIIEDPTYFYLSPNIPNKIIYISHTLIQNDTITVHATNPCKQTNYCDTIKIHGNATICGGQSFAVFTSYKNPACGAFVQWAIPPAGVDSMQVLSDSSVIIYFTNQNWQGTLVATLPAGACNDPAIDSITINVVRTQPQVNLGPDTVLCSNNNILLHAGSSFTTYQWQDGSADSVYTVTNPGIYYVTASDQCGNNFSDTINITAANFPFSIGTDTIRCNNDSLHLTATTGFINYAWHTLYNISSSTGQSVGILPFVDTSYIATAEKWPGCVVRDTIKIRVLNSPPILLGNDTSFCTGQSLILSAGTGFNSYVWSNGSFNPQITVNQPGLYFVKATAANGCISRDSLTVISISPIPVFSLGNDTSLCQNTVYTYNFSMPNASYLWNDGSTSSQYIINQPGTYFLAITQQGCTGKDSIIIGYKNNPVVFIGQDTIICSGNNHTLNAYNNNATYLWQDGSAMSQFYVSEAGDYNVTVNLNNCVVKDTIHIEYLDKPIFTLGGDTTLCAGQKLLFQPLLNTAADYLWQDGSTNPAYLALTTGLFILKATNSCGAFIDSVEVEPGYCDLMMPNSFTPNGDGHNDIFRVKFPFPVESFQFVIYNRYGQKIFETTDMKQGWDGTYQNKQQPIGSYIWVIKFKRMNNFMDTNMGTVTIIQ